MSMTTSPKKTDLSYLISIPRTNMFIKSIAREVCSAKKGGFMGRMGSNYGSLPLDTKFPEANIALLKMFCFFKNYLLLKKLKKK